MLKGEEKSADDCGLHAACCMEERTQSPAEGTEAGGEAEGYLCRGDAWFAHAPQTGAELRNSRLLQEDEDGENGGDICGFLLKRHCSLSHKVLYRQ